MKSIKNIPTSLDYQLCKQKYNIQIYNIEVSLTR